MAHTPACSTAASTAAAAAGPVVERLPLLHELLLQPPEPQQDTKDISILLQLMLP
jgi:hypothetical protein